MPEAIRGAVRNNGGGFYNHNLYFTVMGPNAGGEPTGELAKKINEKFGSFEEFKSRIFKKQRQQDLDQDGLGLLLIKKEN